LNKAKAVSGDTLNQLLDDVIAVGVLNTLEDMWIKLFDEGPLLFRKNKLDSLS
jgi:hypothetical protein